VKIERFREISGKTDELTYRKAIHCAKSGNKLGPNHTVYLFNPICTHINYHLVRSALLLLQTRTTTWVGD